MPLPAAMDPFRLSHIPVVDAQGSRPVGLHAICLYLSGDLDPVKTEDINIRHDLVIPSSGLFPVFPFTQGGSLPLDVDLGRTYRSAVERESLKSR